MSAAAPGLLPSLRPSSSAAAADDGGGGGGGTAPPAPPTTNPARPGAAWLRGLVDHEREGVPDGAGDPGDAARRFDLAPARALLAALGDPQDALPAVAHVAGTKGKGSVAAMLSAALRASGWRVGTYASPHLLSASERAVVGGGGGALPRPMPDDEAERLAQRAAEAASGGGSARLRVSHFEATTAVALRWFADVRVDAAVVECGVGGETDATNVFSGASLAAAVLTPVGNDHLAALGGSVAAAARAKAGILKRGRPAVVAAQPDAEARAALREAVARSGARPVLFLGGDRQGGGALDVRVEAAGPVELLPPPPPSEAAAATPTSRPKFKHLASQPVRVVVLPADAGAAAAAAPPSDAMIGARSLALLRELEALTRASPVRMRLVGRHQRANAAAAVAAAALMAAGDETKQGGAAVAASPPPLTAAAVAQGLSEAFLPGRFQVLGLPPAGPEFSASASALERRRYLILDCAHTPESAEALARTARAALAAAAVSAAATTSAPPPSAPASDADAPPVVLVLAMADDKPHRDVAAQLLYRLRPRAVIFTSVPIAGGRARAASPTTLAAQWQAAAMLPPPPSSATGGDQEEDEDVEDGASPSPPLPSSPSSRRSSDRPPRCREIIQASLKAALQKARRELETALATGGEGGGGGGGGRGGSVGAIVVAGSNHAVAAALRDLGVEDVVEQLE